MVLTLLALAPAAAVAADAPRGGTLTTPSQAHMPAHKPLPPLLPGLVATVVVRPEATTSGMAPLVWRHVRPRPADMPPLPITEVHAVDPLREPVGPVMDEPAAPAPPAAEDRPGPRTGHRHVR